MNTPNTPTTPDGPSSGLQAEVRMLPRILLGLASVLILATLLVRSFAQQYDYSAANVFTLLLGCLSWFTLSLGLATAPLPRWYWRTVAFAPLLMVLITAIFFRVDRINGELLPQLKYRWSVAKPLPSESGEAGSGGISASRLAPRASDWPQFWGPDRTGTVTDISLNGNWLDAPPQIVWKQPIGAGWSSFAVQGDVAVTMEQRANEQWVSAYDVETGALLWHTSTPGQHYHALGGLGPRSTPTLIGNRVLAHMPTGPLLCLDLATGQRIWEIDLYALTGWDQTSAEQRVPWGRTGSPLVIDNLVIVPLGGPKPDSGSLIAVSLQDGHTVWSAGSDGISYSSPQRARLLGVDQVLMVNEQSVTGHEIASGKVLWTVPWPGQSSAAANVSQPIALDESRVLLSKAYGTGCQLVQFAKDADQQWSHRVLWQNKSSLKTKFTSVVVRDHYAYGLNDGILECIDVDTGKQQWKKGRYRQGQLLLVGDKLLITSESGSLVLVAADPKDFSELAKLPIIGDVTWNVPALSGNRLLIRNADEAALVRLPLLP